MWTLAAPGKWVSRAAPQRIRGTRATPGPRPQPPCRGGPRSCVCCFCWGWGPRAPCPHPVTGRSGEGGWGWGRKARVWRLGSDLRCWGVIPGEGSGGKKLAFGVGGAGRLCARHRRTSSAGKGGGCLLSRRWLPSVLPPSTPGSSLLLRLCRAFLRQFWETFCQFSGFPVSPARR